MSQTPTKPSEGFDLVLMAVLPTIIDESLQRKSIITPEALFQLDKTQSMFQCILDADALEKIQLSNLLELARDATEEQPIDIYQSPAPIRRLDAGVTANGGGFHGFVGEERNKASYWNATVALCLTKIMCNAMAEKIAKMCHKYILIPGQDNTNEVDLLLEKLEDPDYDNTTLLSSEGDAWALIEHVELVVLNTAVDKARRDFAAYLKLLQTESHRQDSPEVMNIRVSKRLAIQSCMANLDNSELEKTTLLYSQRNYVKQVRAALKEEKLAEKSVAILKRLCSK